MPHITINNAFCWTIVPSCKLDSCRLVYAVLLSRLGIKCILHLHIYNILICNEFWRV